MESGVDKNKIQNGNFIFLEGLGSQSRLSREPENKKSGLSFCNQAFDFKNACKNSEDP